MRNNLITYTMLYCIQEQRENLSQWEGHFMNRNRLLKEEMESVPLETFNVRTNHISIE